MSSFEILELNDIMEKLVQLVYDGKVVPIIGSGFTRGCKSRKGVVPNGWEAKDLMKNLILEAMPDRTEDEICDLNFNDMSQLFLDSVPIEQRTQFFSNYFTEVNLIKNRKEFITEIDWPCIYTLNVDDAIERTNKYSVVLPYKSLQSNSDNRLMLYKLHGDAHTEITYTHEESIVFSQKQYLKSITDENNKDILHNLMGDYAEKNVLYVGCSLDSEADLEYVFSQIKDSALSMRMTIMDKKPDYKTELKLKKFGVNTVIIVGNFESFYDSFIITYKKYKAEKGAFEYKLVNPQIVEVLDKKMTIRFFMGRNIFEQERNQFIKSGMHVTRKYAMEINEALESDTCVMVQGRRFSGKTYVISDLCRLANRYSIFFFPSSIYPDDVMVMKLFQTSKNSLFLFDSNSVSPNLYKLISNSLLLLKGNGNKIVIAINSSDTFIGSMEHVKIIELDNKMTERNELTELNRKANFYAFIKRRANHTNLDYLQRISAEQKIELAGEIKVDKELDFNDRVIVLLLCAHDKVYVGDLIGLDITICEVESFVDKMKILVEQIELDAMERTIHSGTKIVHNSKISLLNLIREMKEDDFIDTVLFIVRKLKMDKQRKRLYIELILFDTLNQFFQGKEGADNIIFRLYSELESELSFDLHYWLQRAKSIYRLKPNDKELLDKSYAYAKKVYIDGKYELQDKAALSIAIVCCMLAKHSEENSVKQGFYNECIQMAYSAIFSDYYRMNLKNLGIELGRRRKSNLNLLLEVCNKYVEVENQNEDIALKAKRIVEKLEGLKNSSLSTK